MNWVRQGSSKTFETGFRSISTMAATFLSSMAKMICKQYAQGLFDWVAFLVTITLMFFKAFLFGKKGGVLKINKIDGVWNSAIKWRFWFVVIHT